MNIYEFGNPIVGKEIMGGNLEWGGGVTGEHARRRFMIGRGVGLVW